MTARDAARACQAAQDEQSFQQEFERFLLSLRGWCEAHADVVRVGYVYTRDGFLNIVLCTAGEDYQNDTLRDHFPDVWRQYRPLYCLSRLARYWCMPVTAAAVAQARARLAAVETAVAAGM